MEDLDLLKTGKVDYPDIGYNLARRVAAKEFDRGVLICGTGLGMAMIANKVEGVFAGPCHDVYSAERLRKSNDAQILTMGARVIGRELAKTVVSAWLKAEFEAAGRCLKLRECVNWRNSVGKLKMWINHNEPANSNSLWQQLENEQDGERGSRLCAGSFGSDE